MDDIVLPDKTLVPKKSLFEGEVEKVAQKGHDSNISVVAVRFTEIVSKDDEHIPIVARLVAGQQPMDPGSSTVGMPGQPSAAPRSSHPGYCYRVMPNLGPNVLVALRGDLDISEDSILTLLVARAGLPKPTRPEETTAPTPLP